MRQGLAGNTASGVYQRRIKRQVYFSTPPKSPLDRLSLSRTFGIGSTVGPNLSTGNPSLLMINFVKFHLMKFPIVPPCFDLR